MSQQVTNFPYADFQRALSSLQHAIDAGDDIYFLLTGTTGTGKSALLRQLRTGLDRCRYRIVYFSHARRLGSTGLARVLCRSLRLRSRRSHPETVHELALHLSEEPTQLLVFFDEAQQLPAETLDEARTLAESDLAGQRPVRILFAGLPELRERLQVTPPLWRRIMVREELTGLTLDELPGFLDHHFDTRQTQRLCPDGLNILFERGRGVPGLVIPLMRVVLGKSPDGPIDPLKVEDILHSWDLP